MFVEKPLLRREAIEDREYQRNIANSCLMRSTLVVLPTGLGKTAVAVRVLVEVLHRKGGKVLFLAPTKPLVEQHARTLREVTTVDRIAIFTGEVTSPEEREILWRENKIVCSTPQVIKNDLKGGRIALEDVYLLIFDEAHRAVGDYAYVDVAAAYKEQKGLVLGMTASPGSDAQKILEVCSNLGIEGVEIRTEYDPDVVPYVHGIKVELVRVDVPETSQEVRALLKQAFDSLVEELRNKGFFTEKRKMIVKDLLAMQQQISKRISHGERNFHLYRAASVCAMALKVNHALTLVETQGREALLNYFEKLEEESKSEGTSRASKSLMKMDAMKRAMNLVKSQGQEHPKVRKVLDVVRDQFRRKPDSRVIVFTHYRDTSEIVTRELGQHAYIRSVRFVGQASRGEDRGLRQKEQVETIEKFKAGEFNVLVATSVAEEGLDIPATDLVVFFEPVPSEIRTIQRRGRTGRSREGRVVVLATRDTRDEAFFYSARRKERKMHQELETLRRELKQKIFVGEPSGETFVQATPERMMERLSASSRSDVEATKAREGKGRKPKGGQTNLYEF